MPFIRCMECSALLFITTFSAVADDSRHNDIKIVALSHRWDRNGSGNGNINRIHQIIMSFTSLIDRWCCAKSLTFNEIFQMKSVRERRDSPPRLQLLFDALN